MKLQKSVEMSQLKAKYEEKKLDEMKLMSEVKFLQAKIEEKEDLHRKEKEISHKHKKALEEVQVQLLATERSNDSLKTRLSQNDERINKLEIILADKNIQLQLENAKVISMSTQLQEMQIKLQQLETLNNNEKLHFTESMATVTSKCKEEKNGLIAELEKVSKSKTKLEETLLELQVQLNTARNEYTSFNKCLMDKEKECHVLNSSLQKEVVYHSKVTSQLVILQAKYDDLLRNNVQVGKKWKDCNAELVQTQSKLKGSQQNCSALQKEIEHQKDLNERTLKQLEDKSGQLSTRYELKIKDLTSKLEKVKKN